MGSMTYLAFLFVSHSAELRKDCRGARVEAEKTRKEALVVTRNKRVVTRPLGVVSGQFMDLLVN